MYYKINDLNYDERKFNAKLSDLLNWAKKNGRDDIVREAEKINVITTVTDLKKTFYRLNKMRNTEKQSFSASETIKINQAEPSVLVSTKMEQTAPTPQEAPTPKSNDPVPNDPTSFDPLLGANPKQRDYTAGLPTGNAGGGGPGSIPEPDFAGKVSGGFGGVPPDQKDNRFQSTQDLPPNQKKQSSEELANVLVEAYAGNVPALFAYLAKVGEGKLQDLAANGDIDMNIVVDVPNLGKISVGQYFEALNRQADGAFRVTEEWKAEIKPYVVRVLEKKNWGITDEQVILYMIGSHLVQCGMIAYGMRSNNNRLIGHLIANTAALRQSGNLPPQPVSVPPVEPPMPPSEPSTPPPTPPAPPTPPYSSVEEAEIIEPEVEIFEYQPSMEQVEGFEPARQVGSSGGLRNTPPPDEAENMPTANRM